MSTSLTDRVQPGASTSTARRPWVALVALLVAVVAQLLPLASGSAMAAGNIYPQQRVVHWGYDGDGRGSAPAGLSEVTAIAAGGQHSLALKNNGTVVGWGQNGDGQASPPAGLSGVTSIAAGAYHSLALKGDGTVVGWGRNALNQTTVPSGLSGVTAIAAGAYHSLALKGDGTVVAWGYNDWGQTSVPAGLSGVTAIAAGASFSLALKGDGTVVGWGNIGNGPASPPAGLSGVTAIAAGGYHALALKGDGTVVGWGTSYYGQTSVPAGLSGVTAIAAGTYHSLALKSDGTVVGWGDNRNGESSPPAGLSGVTAIAGGPLFSLALAAKSAQTVSFSSSAPAKAYVDAAYVVTASGGASGNPVTLGAGPAQVCTLAGSTVTFTGEGTCTVTADQAGNEQYAAAPQAVQSIAVSAKGAQTVSFSSTAPIKAYVDATYQPTASSTSGLTPTLGAGPSDVCAVNDGTVRFTGAGTCTVTADQAGNEQYAAAPQAKQSIAVSAKGAQTVSFSSTAPAKAYVDGTYDVSATGGASGNPVRLGVDPTSACSIAGSTVTFTGAGTCTVTADQAGSAEYAAAPQATQIIAVSAKGAQAVSFTTTPPGKGYVDGTYDVSATGGASGNPVRIDAGPADVCTIEDGTVRFTGEGTCTVTADQAGSAEYAAAPQATQTIPVSAKQVQSISFSTTAPDAPYVGSTYPVKATSDSGLPVTLASSTSDVCTFADGAVRVIAAGTCSITANQPGDAQTAPASQLQSTTARRVPASLTLDVPTGVVSGQSTTFSAQVTTPEGAPGGVPAGRVQFSLDGDPLGDPVEVGANGTATSPSLTRTTGDHAVGAVFTPADEVALTGAEQRSSLGVAKAQSRTTVSVTPTRLEAVVASVAPGSAPATGSVQFRVAGEVVGSADLVDGVATLDHTVPPGASRQVSADYAGTAELTGSSDSVTRHDPTLTATLSSEVPRSGSGYYRTPVTVHYACTTDGVELTDSCPADDVVSDDGTTTLQRAIHTADGGVASITTRVDLDRTAPAVTLPGVSDGQLVFAHDPVIAPTSSDATSGVASTVTRTVRSNGNTFVYVTATDQAGNATTLRTVYRVVDYAVAGATYSNGAWNVKRGSTFVVQARTPGTPLFVKPATTAAGLATSQTRPMQRTGSDTWSGRVVAPTSTTQRTYFLGIRQGGKTVAVPFRTVG